MFIGLPAEKLVPAFFGRQITGSCELRKEIRTEKRTGVKAVSSCPFFAEHCECWAVPRELQEHAALIPLCLFVQREQLVLCANITGI